MIDPVVENVVANEMIMYKPILIVLKKTFKMPITSHIPWSFCPAFSTPSSLACRQRDQYQPVVTAVAPPLGLLLQLIATATGRTFRQQLTLLERSGHPSLSAYNLHFIPCASGLRTGLANVSGLYLNRQAVATIESLIHGN